MNSQQATHRHTTHEHEHDFEVEPGLPQPLPAGERVLWKGSPDWRALARNCFHLRKLAVYFGVLLAWRIGSVLTDGMPFKQAVVATLIAVGLTVAGLGLVALLAWLSARTTIYTVTDRRVVMRVGIVLSVTFNLPYQRIEAADLRATRSGHGDIALTLDNSTRIAYLHLWPHARPWKVARVQPSLRSIPDAAMVAARLTAAWKTLRAEATSTVRVLRPAQAPVRVGGLPPLQPRPVQASASRLIGDRHLGTVEAA
jgi:hypothetical protein